MKIREAMYKAESAAPPPGAGPQGPGGAHGDDKVVDAEFEEVDEKKKKSA
jgi:molecular chaperone DnaK